MVPTKPDFSWVWDAWVEGGFFPLFFFINNENIFFPCQKTKKNTSKEKINLHSRFVILLWPFSMSQKRIPLVCMVMSMHTRWAKWTKFLLKPRGEDLRFGLYISISTCMGCAVGPSITTSSTDFFPSKTWFFWEFIWIFPAIKITWKINNLPHSESKSHQINSIKSCCSSRSFHQHQRHIPIPPKFSAMNNLLFGWLTHEEGIA